MSEQTPYNQVDGKRKLLPMSIEFVKNPEQRCACVLLLDCSSSMDGENIAQLNRGIIELKKELENDDIASKRVEIAVVKFSSDVEVVSDFATVDNFRAVELSADGVTSMTEAIKVASDMLEERKEEYKQNGVSYYRPWIFMITDGEPTDEDGYVLEENDSRFIEALETIKNGEKNKQFTFFAVGVDNANMETLAKLSPRAMKLKDNCWADMFQWLSKSLVTLSTSTMDTQKAQIAIPKCFEVDIW